MVVIADTSPLNYLVLVDAVEVLPKLYQRLLIPDVVWKELQHPDTPEMVAIWAAQLPPWIEVVPSKALAIDPDLAELDAGEGAAIALAQAQHPDDALLLMDDLKGREEADRRRIRTIGTLGILRDASALGLVDLSTALGRLQRTTFRAPIELVTALLEQDAKRRADKR